MSRQEAVRFAMILAAALGCASPGSQSKPASEPVAAESKPRLPVVPMDSATIERLCAKPDSVRAGKAECVLKDQSPPVRPIVRPSAPPP